MADHLDDDPAAQPRREIKGEIHQDLTLSPAAQAAAMRAEAEVVEAERRRQAAIDHERGEAFLNRLDAAIDASDGPQKFRLAAFKEGLGDTHEEVGGAEHLAAIGRDIRTASGFMTWDETQGLVGGLLNPGQQPRNEVEADEEERRRAGRGGGGMNPADANHSLNIRPDVVSGPAGLETRTTMKSEDYRANPGLEADLAEAERRAKLPALTLEAIERDPWNAVELPLPDNPSEALLKAARSAAEYCAEGEHELMEAAREGRYTPPGWNGAEDEPDVHEYNEGNWLQADKRLGAINDQIDRLEGRGVYAEGARPPDAPPLTNAEYHLYLETLKRYAPDDSVYDVLEEQLYDTPANHAFPPVVDALKALLPDTEGVPYPWPQTFGQVLQHIDDGITAPQAFQQAVLAGFEPGDAEQRAAYDAVTEPARDDIADRLARSDHGPGDEALTPDQTRQRDNEEIVKQQEAERPARGEDVAADPASPATPSLADDLRAAERAAKIERDTEGQESVTNDHGEGKTPGGGGGRGMF